MPTPITRDGPEQAPYAYVLASSEEFTPQAISAVFDGSGAGGDFQPCCSIYTQNGQLVSRDYPSTVTAGSSAEVTFHPFLRAVTSSAPPVSGTNLPYCYAEGDVDTGGTLPSFFSFDTSADGAAIFALSAGSDKIQILATGTYMANTVLVYQDNFSTATDDLILTTSMGGVGDIDYRSVIGPWAVQGMNTGGALHDWIPGRADLITVNTIPNLSNPPVFQIIAAREPAGSFTSIDVSVTIWRMNDALGHDF